MSAPKPINTPKERGSIALFGAVMTLFGITSQDFSLGEYLPAQVIVAVLKPLGFNDAAIRATLRRNAERGLLMQRASGREVHFALSESGTSLVTQGRARVNDPGALDHSSGEWTLLTFPEGPSLRNDRYQLNLRLAWAGFGRLMPNVWLTPGSANVDAILSDAFGDEPAIDRLGFSAVPLKRGDVAPMIARAWDLDAIRAEHDAFLAQWAGFDGEGEHSLSTLVHLLNDWSTLLLADPGLPASGLPSDWPAPASMATQLRVRNLVWASAREELTTLLNM